MAKSIRLDQNTIITVVNTEFNCPKCNKHYEEKDYYKQLYNSKTGIIYKKCKDCNSKIGITADIKGDIRTWLKDKELNYKII